MILEHREPGATLSFGQETVLHGPPRGIGGVHNAAMAVPAFLGEVIGSSVVRALISVEGHAPGSEPGDGRRPPFHHLPHDVGMAQPRTGGERVLDVMVDVVIAVEHGCDAPLSPRGRARRQRSLGKQGDGKVLGKGQGRGKARGATAEDQDIEAVLRTHGVVFMVLRSLEPRAEYTRLGRAAHGNFPA